MPSAPKSEATFQEANRRQGICAYKKSTLDPPGQAGDPYGVTSLRISATTSASRPSTGLNSVRRSIDPVSYQRMVQRVFTESATSSTEWHIVYRLAPCARCCRRRTCPCGIFAFKIS